MFGVLRLFSIVVTMFFFTLCSALGVLIMIFHDTPLMFTLGFLIFLLFIMLNSLTYMLNFKEKSY
ncbi:hypothetical protein D3C87_81380 [compost metagenome]